MYPVARTNFDDVFEKVDLTSKATSFDKVKDDFSSVRSFISLNVVDASPEQFQKLVNSSQDLYRVYVRVLDPDTFKISVFLDGSTVDELSKFARLYGLNFKVVGDSIFIYQSDVVSSEVVSFNYNVTEDEIKVLSSVFPSLSFATFRNRLVVSGSLYDIFEFASFSRSDFDSINQYVLTLVLLRSKSTLVNDLKADLNFESVDLISSGYSLFDLFSCYCSADLTSAISSQYLEQQVYLSSAVPVEVSIGSEINREQRSVSDAGTSSVTGYKDFKDGVDLKATIYEESSDLFVKLSFERSKFTQVDAISKDITRIDYERLKVNPSTLYYLCQFSEDTRANSTGLVSYLKNNSQEVVTVWFCIFPVKNKKSY